MEQSPETCLFLSKIEKECSNYAGFQLEQPSAADVAQHLRSVLTVASQKLPASLDSYESIVSNVVLRCSFLYPVDAVLRRATYHHVLSALCTLVLDAYSDSESLEYRSILYHLLLVHCFMHPTSPTIAFTFTRRKDLPLVLLRQFQDTQRLPLHYATVNLLWNMLKTANPVPRSLMKRITKDLVLFCLENVERWPGLEAEQSAQAVMQSSSISDMTELVHILDSCTLQELGSVKLSWISYHHDLMYLLVYCLLFPIDNLLN